MILSRFAQNRLKFRKPKPPFTLHLDKKQSLIWSVIMWPQETWTCHLSSLLLDNRDSRGFWFTKVVAKFTLLIYLAWNEGFFSVFLGGCSGTGTVKWWFSGDFLLWGPSIKFSFFFSSTYHCKCLISHMLVVLLLRNNKMQQYKESCPDIRISGSKSHRCHWPSSGLVSPIGKIQNLEYKKMHFAFLGDYYISR